MKARAWIATTALAVVLTGAAGAALAQQSISVRDNGSIKLRASVTDVTRISLVGDDRIRRIVKDNTSFQEMNDEETGDVFLRYAGDQAKLVPETGFIITEAGRTIGYTLEPTASLGNQTILITVSGGASASSRSAPASGGTGGAVSASSPAQSFQLEATGGAGGSGYTATLVAFMRAAIVKHALGRQAPNRADGAVIATVAGSGLRARVIVVSGGARGRNLAERNFQGPKTVAVWLEKDSLFPGERGWAIIVDRG